MKVVDPLRVQQHILNCPPADSIVTITKIVGDTVYVNYGARPYELTKWDLEPMTDPWKLRGIVADATEEQENSPIKTTVTLADLLQDLKEADYCKLKYDAIELSP